MSRDPSSAFAREVPEGTVLFEEKDPGTRMYVIRSGRVKIFRLSGEREVVLAFLGAGDFFGEMALLENLPRSASAMTVEDSTLIEVDVNTFEEMIRRNIEVAVRIMRKLAARVRELDQRIEKLLVDTAQGRALEVLRWLLPQGLVEGDWIRVGGAAAHLDIATQAGIPEHQAAEVMKLLARAGCVRLDDDDLLIAHHEVLDAYHNFLDLKRKYGQTADSGPADHKPQPKVAMKRLLKALALPQEHVDNRQTDLAKDYERYQDLMARFGSVEGDD